jgi:hypothetical protein
LHLSPDAYHDTTLCLRSALPTVNVSCWSSTPANATPLCGTSNPLAKEVRVVLSGMHAAALHTSWCFTLVLCCPQFHFHSRRYGLLPPMSVDRSGIDSALASSGANTKRKHVEAAWPEDGHSDDSVLADAGAPAAKAVKVSQVVKRTNQSTPVADATASRRMLTRTRCGAAREAACCLTRQLTHACPPMCGCAGRNPSSPKSPQRRWH